MVEAQNPIASGADGLNEPRLIEEAGSGLRIGRIAAPVLRALGLRLPDSRPTPSPFGGKGKRVDCQAHRCTSRRSRKAECRTM